MNLVCLGVIQHILNYLTKGPVCKISAVQLREISDRLFMLNGKMSGEIARRPKSLQELDCWKAISFIYSSCTFKENCAQRITSTCFDA